MKKVFLTDDKEIMKFWNYEKNEKLGINPKGISKWSKERVWWICPNGHEWKNSILRLSRGSRCPYCNGYKVLSGYNDLATTNPQILTEWNYEKNEILGIDPQNISKGSRSNVWWKCKKGHEWQVPVSRKTSGNSGCPICSNRKVLKGYNDLATINPDLVKEWNYEKNTELTPYDVVYSTNKKVWWKCSNCHYKWYAAISSRTVNGSGCPNCRGIKVANSHNKTGIKKHGSLSDSNPELLKEWNYEKNDFSPDNVHKWSSKKVWWKCSKCDNEWKTTINQRAISGTGCPNCNGEMQTSFPEQAIQYYLSKIFGKDKVINRYLVDNRFEVDIFLNEQCIGIEYDGAFFHKGKSSKEKENAKNTYLKDKNIKLIRVKEGILEKRFHDDLSCDIIGIKKNSKYDDYDLMLKALLERINELLKTKFEVIFDTEKDRIQIMENYINVFKEKSLASVNEELAEEWNYEKNGKITPDMVMPFSTKKVWWKCSKGHEWEYKISDRCHGDGCPICSNRQVLKGYNDLATINKNLAKEWNYEKNKNITPEDVVYGTNKKVWWKCKKGHEWQAKISDRNKGSRCPYCANKKVLQGYNDLATTNPDLVKEWNYEKNDNIKVFPTEITNGVSKKVWWKCKTCGNEWQTSIYSRTKGYGCPVCGYKKSAEKFIKNKIKQNGSLLKNHPELIKYWDYEKNIKITPDKVTSGSNKKVWWKCDKNHRYEQTIAKKVSGRGCPYCANKKVLKGYNDLLSKYPIISAEWNYSKNYPYKPEDFVYGSYKKVWWKCSECDNEWETLIATRTMQGCGCPKCNKTKKIKKKINLLLNNKL